MDTDLDLKVTFSPPLYQQRRIWILDTLREEAVVDVLDVGCGEGQLLSALCQPAPWLAFNGDASELEPGNEPMNLFNSPLDPIPNLHMTRVAGLDISDADLDFAMKVTEPEEPQESTNGDTADGGEMGGAWGHGTTIGGRQPVRWESMTANIWKGGLEVVNEEFVDVECIVATEVIEHLPPETFPFFAPVLLGVYQPRLLLVTTPSYTFNARFTAPDAPQSRKSGYPDPTGRTDRIFRHSDHKFEWTPEEFKEWCVSEANRWGYDIELADIGRAYEVDEWGRDEELGGATLVATFQRKQGVIHEMQTQAREVIRVLQQQGTGAQDKGDDEDDGGETSTTQPDLVDHQLLVSYQHPAHDQARKPIAASEIREIVKGRMEEYRESFMRLEDLWYERDIGIACGGWVEVLIKALLEPNDLLTLKQDGDATGLNVQRQRELWKAEVLGDPNASNKRMLWPSTEEGMDENEKSIEYMPADWNPEEDYRSEYEDRGYHTASSSASGEGGDGDISWNEDEGKAPTWGTGDSQWNMKIGSSTGDGWGMNEESGGWDEELNKRKKFERLPSNASSTTGWDGDESDDTS
ncbi:hypothetical protein V5O48_002716 [Marasmius crinis-equi]|uniref:Small RNA 2'-O-methyltransferase n=1 Tax=Marasmius crinis-equi TaxID=585013 RepID=A0ABR3FV21_9AGAR